LLSKAFEVKHEVLADRQRLAAREISRREAQHPVYQDIGVATSYQHFADDGQLAP